MACTRWIGLCAVVATLSVAGCDGGGGGTDDGGGPGMDGGMTRDAGPGSDASTQDGGGGDATRTRDGGTGADGGAGADASDDASTSTGDDGGFPDAGPQTCEADGDLGSATGTEVATGSTEDGQNRVTPECRTGSSAPDAIFTWTVPETGAWTFDTNGSDFDTVLHVRDGSCSPLGCDDDGGGALQSRVDLELTAGTEVFIAVDGYGTREGAFLLNIHQDVAEQETVCDDGIDEDRNGDTDCADQACRESEPDRCIETVCDDEMDDDEDGAPDCMDSDCFADEGCVEHECGDDVDNELDGLTDCEDPDCFGEPVCIESVCDDEMDEDEDGDVDCDDSDCANIEPCIETMCDDGGDGDMDGDTDCGDRDCSCAEACVIDRCPDMDLGSAVGESVATGTVEAHECGTRVAGTEGATGCTTSNAGRGGERTFTWTAPSAGSYTFDTEGSDYDTVVYLLDGTCDGSQLACDDDGGTSLQSTLTTDLSSGQTVVIVIDGYSETSGGAFVLNITAE